MYLLFFDVEKPWIPRDPTTIPSVSRYNLTYHFYSSINDFPDDGGTFVLSCSPYNRNKKDRHRCEITPWKMLSGPSILGFHLTGCSTGRNSAPRGWTRAEIDAPWAQHPSCRLISRHYLAAAVCLYAGRHQYHRNVVTIFYTRNL